MSYPITIITNTAKAFVVPNKILPVTGFGDYKWRRPALDRLCELNEWPAMTDDVPLVEIWLADKETLHSDDLMDHGCTIDTETMTMNFRVSSMYKTLPLLLFENKDEGDSMNIKIPITLYELSGDQKEYEGILDMEVTMDQLSYRYRNYGTFKETIELLKKHM